MSKIQYKIKLMVKIITGALCLPRWAATSSKEMSKSSTCSTSAEGVLETCTNGPEGSAAPPNTTSGVSGTSSLGSDGSCSNSSTSSSSGCAPGSTSQSSRCSSSVTLTSEEHTRTNKVSNTEILGKIIKKYTYF